MVTVASNATATIATASSAAAGCRPRARKEQQLIRRASVGNPAFSLSRTSSSYQPRRSLDAPTGIVPPPPILAGRASRLQGWQQPWQARAKARQQRSC